MKVNIAIFKNIFLLIAFFSVENAYCRSYPSTIYESSNISQKEGIADTTNSVSSVSLGDETNAVSIGDGVIPFSLAASVYCIILIRRRRRNHIELNDKDLEKEKIRM
ncbi:MAG: hypothetical protein P4L28_09070 [Paludibacteraceae bacterium]|nr:hypothetical protein [Paludibacteraceae bacterium]